MSLPNEKLAESLKFLRKLQQNNGTVLRSQNLPRIHRERLLKNNFIHEVIKGWYIITNPIETKGESTLWYSSYWYFCSKFLEFKYKKNWCISPEQSISIQSGNLNIPKQLLIRSPKANNTLTELPYHTSLFNSKSELPNKSEIEVKNGLRILSIPSALVNCNPNFFKLNPIDSRTALAMIKDASEILNPLLKEGRSVVAGRLAGAFRNIGRERIANEIKEGMKAADYTFKETDPFINKVSYKFPNRITSPYVIRITQMWEEMRETILKHFPQEKGIPKDVYKYLNYVQEVYTTDAYHSLSIEGYQVTAELIDRVAKGTWDADIDEKDKEFKNAMTAKGYFQAFQSVKLSIEKILNKKNSGEVVDNDHGQWYRELFSPSVTAGILKSSDLAGYRNAQVYIRHSSHVPMGPEAVRDTMPAFFDLLKQEKEAPVRIVMGHFIFVYIHPYMDGNGRMGRFIMNAMLASGGYPWTVIPVEERDLYLQALEKASVYKDIEPFTKYLARLVNAGLSGHPIAKKILIK